MVAQELKEMPCEACALKHLAKAEELANETRLGYPQNFWRALANLSLAEDHLAEKHIEWARRIRTERKAWEVDPSYRVPFDMMLRELAHDTGYDLDTYLLSLNKEYLYEHEDRTVHQ